MSLINDALKRASKSDKDRAAQAASPPLMQPAAPSPGVRSSWLLAAIAATVLALTVTGWVFLKSSTAGHAADAPGVDQAAQTAAVQPPSSVPSPPENTSVPAPAPSAPAPGPPPDAWPTNLTLKAIFYSKTNPRALLNGTMVETGDKINGVLVTGILSDRVFVDWNGQTRELKLGGR
jgi:hypothetical protein